MAYKVKFSKSAVKELAKLDQQTIRLIKNWVIKNLVNTKDPIVAGKALTGNLKGIWRYRVGNYRLFAKIKDRELIVLIFQIAHRKDI